MTEQQRKNILIDVVNTFKNKQWFRDATVYDLHPITGIPTLEFKVNFLPLLEKVQIKEFASKYSLNDRYVIAD